MKIAVKELSYEEAMALPNGKHTRPVYQSRFFRFLLKTLSEGELKKVGFTLASEGMEKIGADEPCLFLMNHSCFLDLEIASKILYPRQFHIVCTQDGFVGKELLLKKIGCIPTKKFMADLTLIKDMQYAVKELHSSVLMYPEASYSFDGTATPLPASLGKFIKLLKIPVVMIKTEGAFLRDPLYNGLRLRDVKVKAKMYPLATAEEIKEKSAEELNEMLREAFTFDHFRKQKEDGVLVKEDFRAEGLERVLYKCPHCLGEGKMHGRGTEITCGHCGKTYTLREDGLMEARDGITEYAYIPDWYAFERASVRKELEEGTYRAAFPVDILLLKDTKACYRVGTGELQHTVDGFTLTGCDGKLSYKQSPLASYSLYADYFWYEIGDMVSIGTNEQQYYCFPKCEGIDVAKLRLAAEELYKMNAGTKRR